ncbi:stage II sporulation protein M [Sphingomonas sp. G-3-2-10]|uniref:stage II sporulation protein M n=1 Tax=Sphingomonas sp. G-3-2-10 TaxID=2728838 RepID=UPI00146F86B7|nr:stage II sporulation protein M [Sphingomonas sp. G-3-2-10]
MTALAPASGLAVSSVRFREARQYDWLRLEELLDQVERGKASSLSDEDLFEMPVLYRATLSSLSVARETSLDADLVAYLESLSTRAYFILYGVHAPLTSRLARFFAHDWPLAVRTLWRETLVSLGMILIGAIAAYLVVRGDPSWFYSIVPGNFLDGRDPSASVEELRATLYDTHDGLAGFATELFVHNSSVAIFAFALGFAFGVPTTLLMLYNGCILGAFYAVYVPKGLGWNFTGWLSIHGTTELFAIGLAGAAGLRIGMASAFPGRLTRMKSTIASGRTSGFAMLGVVVMLLCAGLLEGIGRQTIRDDIVRGLIATAMLSFWIFYFYLMPLRRGDEADG